MREARTGGSILCREVNWPASDLLRALEIHLSSVCAKVRLKRSTNRWKDYLFFFEDLFHNSRSLTVITFNYDLLVEQILDDLGIRLDYGADVGIRFDNAKRLRRLTRAGTEVQMMKLHGSANWGVCRGCNKVEQSVDLVTAFERAYVPTRRTRCPSCMEKYLETGIIPPVLGKAGEARHIEPVWANARKTLRRAREIIVIGYSLPDSDAEAKSLMREVRFLRRRPRIRIVCGTGGAPRSYSEVFARFTDTREYTEDFLSGWS